MHILSDAVLDELTELAQAATNQRWQWGHSATTTLEEATAYVADQLAKSDQSDIQMIFVGDPAIPGDTRVVAITGNGPTSEANARYITALSPDVMLSLVREVRAARRRP